MSSQLKAVVATRISRLTESTTSPESQVINARAYAESHGWTVVGEASDLDVSASNIAPWDREELGYWLANPDRFDVLVFRHIDRVARNGIEFNDLLKWSRQNDIRLVCLEPNIDFSTTIGQLIATVIAYVAQMEADAIKSRVQGARRYMRSVARWPAGKPPFGYRTVPHPSGSGFALDPDPEHAPIIEEIVSRVIGGESFGAIVTDLNNREVPVPASRAKRTKNDLSSARWTASTIRRILTNPATRGRVHHDGRVVRYPPGHEKAGQPLLYGPPLIDDDTWPLVQKALADRARPDRAAEGQSLLAGVAECAICGSPMYAGGSTAPDQLRNRIYRCVGRQFYGRDCPGNAIRMYFLDEYVEREFLRRVGDMPYHVVIPEEPADNTASTALADIEERLAELREDRKAGLYRGPKGNAEFRSMYSALEDQRALLEAAQHAPAPAQPSTPETSVPFAHEWQMTADTATRRRLLQDAGVVVYVAKGNPGKREFEERVEFAMRGPEDLHAEGHDDPTLGMD